MNNLPKLLKDSIEQNEFDIDIITKKYKLPWLKLDLQSPELSTDYLSSLFSSAEDLRTQWKTQWKFNLREQSSYQVNGWVGQIFFGPRPFDKFLTMVNECTEVDFSRYDEDNSTRYFRDKIDYGWNVDIDDPLRNWISSFIPDKDLNLVNSYWSPPGGYVFPHRDYSQDNMGLNKLYVAASWKPGNVFGFYGVGNLPIKDREVFLINNYTLPHWVQNASDSNRLVISISSNLHSPRLKELIQKSFSKLFLE